MSDFKAPCEAPSPGQERSALCTGLFMKLCAVMGLKELQEGHMEVKCSRCSISLVVTLVAINASVIHGWYNACLLVLCF